MTNIELDAFLAVCRYKNITKAAEELFITQSALSARLKSLEENVGCPLFLRNKGKREITLTAQGRAVYSLALQHQDILSKIEAIGTSVPMETLRISALTSVGNYLLPPALDRFMEQYPHIHIMIENMAAISACPLLIAGNLDLAFVTAKTETDQIVATPVLSDPLTLLCSNDSDYPETVTQSMLRTKDEVFSNWSAEATYWHQTAFGADTIPFIKMQFMEQIGPNIAKPGKWGFVPQSMADCLCKTLPVHQCKTTFTMPDRTIYVLRFRDTAEAPNTRLFLDTLRADMIERKIQGVLL